MVVEVLDHDLKAMLNAWLPPAEGAAWGPCGCGLYAMAALQIVKVMERWG